MTKTDLLEKIDKLIDLCVETEPTLEDMNTLDLMFSTDFIQAKEIRSKIEDGDYSDFDLVDMMKECNWIWKKRNKIKEKGWDEYINIDLRIEKSLRGNRKIEAIKLYRQNIIDNGGDCGLKEAKEYIDKLVIRMGLD
jgi:ribosomal protein L7/L12